MARLGGKVGKATLGRSALRQSALYVLCSLVLVNCDSCAPPMESVEDEDENGLLDLGGRPVDGQSSGGRAGGGGATGGGATDGTGGQSGTTSGGGSTSGGGTSSGGFGGSMTFCGADDPECCTPAASYCESGWRCQGFVGAECATPLVCHEACAFGCLAGACLPDPNGMGGMGGSDG